ncbi:hypothetical protein OG589_33485 [Sphaerisporangium sp. NBC_01403]|uniref:hypothetical protein n=1 Tax=Sphaerisporangium sp. NBC_01403 TaxID=2903599 RepID=UPI00324ECD1E
MTNEKRLLRRAGLRDIDAIVAALRPGVPVAIAESGLARGRPGENGGAVLHAGGAFGGGPGQGAGAASLSRRGVRLLGLGDRPGDLALEDPLRLCERPFRGDRSRRDTESGVVISGRLRRSWAASRYSRISRSRRRSALALSHSSQESWSGGRRWWWCTRGRSRWHTE